jgi:hypothetical protein
MSYSIIELIKKFLVSRPTEEHASPVKNKKKKWTPKMAKKENSPIEEIISIWHRKGFL